MQIKISHRQFNEEKWRNFPMISVVSQERKKKKMSVNHVNANYLSGAITYLKIIIAFVGNRWCSQKRPLAEWWWRAILCKVRFAIEKLQHFTRVSGGYLIQLNGFVVHISSEGYIEKQSDKKWIFLHFRWKKKKRSKNVCNLFFICEGYL